jgi:hypothetical protein
MLNTAATVNMHSLTALLAFAAVGSAAPTGRRSAGLPDINVADVPLVGQLVSGNVDSLPVDVSVSAPILPSKREPAVSIDLGGTDLSLKSKRDAAK